jgi:hypothetical protein
MSQEGEHQKREDNKLHTNNIVRDIESYMERGWLPEHVHGRTTEVRHEAAGASGLGTARRHTVENVYD